MTESAKDTAAIDVADLLTRYSFDLGNHTVQYLVDRWTLRYPALWLRSAVIEALYQGRYKAVSVEQILLLWKRRGKPLQHFNREFERIICTQHHFPNSERSRSPVEPSERSEETAAVQSEQQAELVKAAEPANRPQSLASKNVLSSEATAAVHQPILQFVPIPEVSPFYDKLKAVVEEGESSNGTLTETNGQEQPQENPL